MHMQMAMSHTVTRHPARRLACRLNVAAWQRGCNLTPSVHHHHRLSFPPPDWLSKTHAPDACVSHGRLHSYGLSSMTVVCKIVAAGSSCYVWVRTGQWTQHESKSQPEPGSVASEVQPGRQDVVGHGSLRQTRFLHSRHWVATEWKVPDGGVAAQGGSSLCDSPQLVCEVVN